MHKCPFEPAILLSYRRKPFGKTGMGFWVFAGPRRARRSLQHCLEVVNAREAYLATRRVAPTRKSGDQRAIADSWSSGKNSITRRKMRNGQWREMTLH